MATVVLDSTNLPAVLADAGVTLDGETNENASTETGKVKPEGTQKADGTDTKTVAETHQDHEEDENGLTEEERRDLSAKMQKAVGKRHRMMKEAEEFAAAQYNERKLAEKRADDAQRELEALKGKAVASAEPEKQKPQRQDYGTESEYIDASIQWGVDQGLKKQAEEQARQVAERAQEAIIEAAQERVNKAIDLVPDFKEVTESADIMVPPAVAGYMQKSEMFAELGYYLAKNQDVLKAIAKLAPDEQLVKIGKLEDKLEPFGKKGLTNNKEESNFTASDTKSEVSKGATPSKEAPSHDKTASSENTGIFQSTARNKGAPVISPLNGSGSAATEINPENIREVITDFAKRNQVNMSRRKRH